MTDFSEFYPFIMPDMPGCLDVAVDAELRKVAHRFCNDTWAYQTTVTESVTKGDETVTPTLPENTSLVGVAKAENQDGDAYYDLETDGNDVLLGGTADSDFTLTLTLAIKPTMGAADVPDLLYDEHMETIVAGVKAGLFLSPKKSWTSPELAVYWKSEYLSGAGSAKRRAFYAGMPTERRAQHNKWI